MRGSGAVHPTKDASGQTNPTEAVVACNPAVGKALAATLDVGNDDVDAAPLKFDVGNEDAPAAFTPAVGKVVVMPAPAPIVGKVLWTDDMPPEAGGALENDDVPAEVPAEDPAEVPAEVPAELPAKVGNELAGSVEPIMVGNGVGLAPSPAPSGDDGGLTSPPPDGGPLPYGRLIPCKLRWKFVQKATSSSRAPPMLFLSDPRSLLSAR